MTRSIAVRRHLLRFAVAALLGLIAVAGCKTPADVLPIKTLLDDLVAAIGHVLDHDALEGAVNAAAPGAVTNREFTRALARVLRRPALLPLPAAVLRLALGGIADEALLASARVEPRRLAASGFTFRFPELEPALRHVLA